MNKAVKDKRPVNLNLFTVRLPLTAYASIMHRISGGIAFFGVAVLLTFLDGSLASKASFIETLECFDTFIGGFALWVAVGALVYHCCAGVKHMIMDLGYGESFEGGTKNAKLVLIISAILILSVGLWIW